MDKLHVWPGIPVPMGLVCLCYLWCVSLSQWEWTWMSGWLLGLCYCKQCAQSARLRVWKKTRMQIFFACIVTQTLLGITPGLIFFNPEKFREDFHFNFDRKFHKGRKQHLGHYSWGSIIMIFIQLNKMVGWSMVDLPLFLRQNLTFFAVEWWLYLWKWSHLCWKSVILVGVQLMILRQVDYQQ